MQLYVIIPTFNRVRLLRQLIEDLDEQEHHSANVRVVVVNDGSTDETESFLASRDDIYQVKTAGERWWPGAVNDAVKYICDQFTVEEDDYVLLLNDDTRLPKRYLSSVLRVIQASRKLCLGSMIRHIETEELISVGARQDSIRLKLWDLICTYNPNNKSSVKLSFLSGRGSIFPAKEFLVFGRSNEFFTPQYFADYLISHRFAANGFDLVVHPDVYVFSDTNFGNMKKYDFLRRYFWKRSSNYIFGKIYFELSTLKRSFIPLYPFLVFIKLIWTLIMRGKK